MKDDSSDASQAAVAAISSGRPRRPIGTFARNPAITAGSAWRPAAIRVSIVPGQIPLTRMPRAARSSAAARTSVQTPPFDAEYDAVLASTDSQRAHARVELRGGVEEVGSGGWPGGAVGEPIDCLVGAVVEFEGLVGVELFERDGEGVGVAGDRDAEAGVGVCCFAGLSGDGALGAVACQDGVADVEDGLGA